MLKTIIQEYIELKKTETDKKQSQLKQNLSMNTIILKIWENLSAHKYE